MWRDRPAQEATRLGLYWNQIVTGGPGQPAEIAESDIDPTLVQTISWLERMDDTRPASAEFSRQFETQFLQAIGAAPTHDAPRLKRSPATVPAPLRRQSTRRHPPVGGPRWVLASIAATFLFFIALAGLYYVFEHRGESPGANVILAPSSTIDVPMDRGNAQRSGVMPGPGITDNLTLGWSFAVGRDGISAPVIVGDTIFITNGLDQVGTSADQGSVVAIDASNGSERWRFPTEHATETAPTVAGGIVYAGDAGGIVYALDAVTGEEHWRKALPGSWTSEPVAVGDAVFLAVASARAPLHLAIQDGTVVVGSGFVGQPADGFRLYSFDRLTGNERWRSGDDQSGQPGLFAFDSESGDLAWHVAMPSLESGPAIDDGLVFAGSTLATTIYALDLASGAEAWQAEIGADLPLNSSPAISAGSVFVTTASGSIFSLDERSGKVHWQASAQHASLNSSAVVVGNTVYVVDTAFGVSAFSATDGTALWSEQLELTGQVAVSPVIVNGTLYIGTSLEANTAYAATLWALVDSSGG